MDLDVVAGLLEKAGEYSILIGAHRNKASRAGRQPSVVAKGGHEAAALGQAARDTAAEPLDRAGTVKVRECIAHAEYELGAFARRKVLCEREEVVAVRANRQARRGGFEFGKQVWGRINGDDAPTRACQRNGMHSEPGTKIDGQTGGWEKRDEIRLTERKRSLRAANHPGVDGSEKG